MQFTVKSKLIALGAVSVAMMLLMTFLLFKSIGTVQVLHGASTTLQEMEAGVLVQRRF